MMETNNNNNNNNNNNSSNCLLLLPSSITAILSTTSSFSLQQVLVAVIVIYIAYSIIPRYHQFLARRKELHVWIQRARGERASKTFAILQNKTPFDDYEDDQHQAKILSLTVAELAQKMKQALLSSDSNHDHPNDNKSTTYNEYHPINVITFFSKRARLYGRNEERVNAITEEFYDDALEQAQQLSQKYKSSSSSSSLPLLGIPISVKECCAMQGAYSTGGLACRLNRRMAEDCLIVKLVKRAGAIPICCGNTVQTMMLPDCVNHIWGRSRNPWDLKRTPGGSSGGDAALVAMGCVPLAIGTDVGGSIRIPAAYCGVIGFKPTSTRLSLQGCMRPRKGDRMGVNIVNPTVPGPIARTVDDCALFMETVCVPELWESDLNLPPLPFDKNAYEQKGSLKLGYFETDTWFEPCSAAKRGLMETIQKLKDAGHECIPIEPPTNGWFNYSILLKVSAAEGRMRSFLEGLEGEALIPEFKDLRLSASLPDFLRWILCKILDKRRASLLGCTRRNGKSVYELWQVLGDIMEMRKKWEAVFKQSGIDALIYPAVPVPAMPHGFPGKLTAPLSYMFLANMLLWPCGVVPVTRIHQDEQHYDIDDLPSDQQDYYARLAQKVMEGSAGLPMSVCVLSPAFQDEKCLRVMKEVERVVEFKDQPRAYLNRSVSFCGE